MSRADEVLDAIDHALEDDRISGDAMRWAPEPVAHRSRPRYIPPHIPTRPISITSMFGARERAEAEAWIRHGDPSDEVLHVALGVLRSGRVWGRQREVRPYLALPDGLNCPPPMSAHETLIGYPWLFRWFDDPARRTRPPRVARPTQAIFIPADTPTGPAFTYETLDFYRCHVRFLWGAHYEWPVLLDSSGRWYAGQAERIPG